MNFSKKIKKKKPKPKSEWCSGKGSLAKDNLHTKKNLKKKYFRCPKCNKRLLPKDVRDDYDKTLYTWIIPAHKEK